MEYYNNDIKLILHSCRSFAGTATASGGGGEVVGTTTGTITSTEAGMVFYFIEKLLSKFNVATENASKRKGGGEEEGVEGEEGEGQEDKVFTRLSILEKTEHIYIYIYILLYYIMQLLLLRHKIM